MSVVGAIVLYSYMFTFAETKTGLGSHLCLAWAAWVSFWAGVIIAILATLNACWLINLFDPPLAHLISHHNHQKNTPLPSFPPFPPLPLTIPPVNRIPHPDTHVVVISGSPVSQAGFSVHS